MKRTFLVTLIVIATSNLWAAPGAHGPNGEHLDTNSSVDGSWGRQSDGSVALSMRQQAVLGVRTELTMSQSVATTVQLAAMVRAHPRGHALVQPSSDGRISTVAMQLPLTGDWVEQGQALAYLQFQDNAYEQASQSSELAAIRYQLAQTERDLKRLQALEELADQQSVERLKTQLQSLLAQEQALQTGLELPEPLRAPISGYVINHGVRNGQWVEAGTTLFEVVSADQRLLEVSADQQLSAAAITAARFTDRPGELVLRGVAPAIQQGLQQLIFEYQADGSEPLLIDQPLEIVALLDQQQQGVVLPADAVVRNNANLPVVWLKVSAERCMPQEVRYHAFGAGQVVIVAGLSDGQRVVVQAASRINQVR